MERSSGSDASHLRLGATGEDFAAQWYESSGYVLLDRNWRGRRGELDLVVGRPGRGRRLRLVVFAEVKTRRTDRYGAGVLAVDDRKQGRIRRLAGEWLAGCERPVDEARFDIVDVDGRGHLRVYEAAF